MLLGLQHGYKDASKDMKTASPEKHGFKNVHSENKHALQFAMFPQAAAIFMSLEATAALRTSPVGFVL